MASDTLEAYDLTDKRIWVAGHRGMVGSAIIRRLETEPIADIVTAASDELDLRDPAATAEFVRTTRPDVAIIAAAKVGGIEANRSAQGEFLYDNLMIAANTIEASRVSGVQKVVMLGSSCIYPRDAPQPMHEDSLLTGPLEPTNEGYAIAKIAALELAKMYRRQYGMDAIALMPTNLYGPGDNYDLAGSHVLPALMRKMHEAMVNNDPTVTLWGTGAPKREFLHVDDLADAVVFVTKHYSGEQHLNVGTGKDISIRDLASLIAEVVGWSGDFDFDTSMPDGTPRKLLDVGQLERLGWSASTDLRHGISQTYESYVAGEATD
ncbi:MAG: GDP-L-fucose synthase [Actinomycetia bacterium]|nr:GDP-L-fucose synthase [Actinomycetes bacterium]